MGEMQNGTKKELKIGEREKDNGYWSLRDVVRDHLH
jgi:hypothetical protein